MDFLQQVKEAQTIIVFYYFLALKNTAPWITFLSTTQYGTRQPDRSFFFARGSLTAGLHRGSIDRPGTCKSLYTFQYPTSQVNLSLFSQKLAPGAKANPAKHRPGGLAAVKASETTAWRGPNCLCCQLPPKQRAN